jgi:predicted transcriptional regulator
MKLKQISEILEAEILVGKESLDPEIKSVCGADMLSDVLAFTESESLLLTGLISPQVIRTVEIADIKAICFVRGKHPSGEMIKSAQERDIALLCTSLLMYESCGRLYAHNLPGCSATKDR